MWVDAETPYPSRTPHGRLKMTSHADRLRRQTEFLNDFLNKCNEKNDRNHPGRPDENDTPSPNLLVVVVVLVMLVLVLASREWKAGYAGIEICGWTLKP